MGKNLRTKMSPERQAEVLGYFDKPFGFALDLAEETQMKELMEQYLFYDTGWTERNIRACYCTRCGGFDQFRRDGWNPFWEAHHNDVTECPNCGSDVTMKALGRMSNFSSINDADERRFSIFRAAPDGGAAGDLWLGAAEIQPQRSQPGY